VKMLTSTRYYQAWLIANRGEYRGFTSTWPRMKEHCSALSQDSGSDKAYALMWRVARRIS
jgi:hypothetical protein